MIEKNRDARLLSPTALLDASLHRRVELVRTEPKTGKVSRLTGILESDREGVVFRSAAGVEALRCSGLPETFHFDPFAGAHAVPTLSVRVRSDAPVTRTVSLSYLASGFDWSATYTATLSADGRTLNLGAWVTLANGNGEDFTAAQIQVVAGRLHREAVETMAADEGGPILAQCWPRGSTSDGAAPPPRFSARAPAELRLADATSAPAPLMMRAMSSAPAQKVVQEQLGDLKLYRVPQRTTVAARQLKQVRLLDQADVPVRHVYRALVDPHDDDSVPIRHELRTRNTDANHLGLPLPAGSLAVYGGGGAPLLLAQDQLADRAIDEELAIPLGTSPDVHITAITEQRAIDPAGISALSWLPGLALRSVGVQTVRRVEISNASGSEADVEVVLLLLGSGDSVVRADRPAATRHGQPIFSVRVPANGRATLRYATARTVDQRVRAR